MKKIDNKRQFFHSWNHSQAWLDQPWFVHSRYSGNRWWYRNNKVFVLTLLLPSNSIFLCCMKKSNFINILTIDRKDTQVQTCNFWKKIMGCKLCFRYLFNWLNFVFLKWDVSVLQQLNLSEFNLEAGKQPSASPVTNTRRTAYTTEFQFP